MLYSCFTHALLMLIQVALRDPNGFRPLVIGRMRGRGKVGKKKKNYNRLHLLLLYYMLYYITHAFAHALLMLYLVQGGSDGFCVASETCALDMCKAEYVRDVEPGEMV